jgi:hypothetical protein
MDRRKSLAAGLGLMLGGGVARAHHGWSSFDQNRPIFLSGRAREVKWRNPHAELILELDAPLALPADLALRQIPAQTAGIDGPALLKRTILPTRRDPRWEIELAPISRMNLWKVPQIQDGQQLSLVGFTFTGEQGSALLRAEYLFLGNQIYGLRSSPA